MERRNQSFDVCIVCALPEEARAFLEVLRQQCEGTLEERISPHYHYSYRFATIKNDKDEPLNLHVSWLPRYGLQEMSLHLSRVLEECQPRVAIMVGICAGDAQQVRLGDLVVAERTFTYDNGKFTLDEHDRSIHLHDTMTYQLPADILQFLGLFDDWKPLVARLKRPPSPFEQRKRRKIACHIKAMASGNAVRADNPFEGVRAPVRGTVAIDMEGAAFGLVMSRHPLTRWLIVKGVCDYADRTKSDAYHDYAARASALYALSFIQAYVTNERLPRPDGPSPANRAETSRKKPPTQQSYTGFYGSIQGPVATGSGDLNINELHYGTDEAKPVKKEQGTEQSAESIVETNDHNTDFSISIYNTTTSTSLGPQEGANGYQAYSYSISDLQEGDVIISRQALYDLLDLMEYRTLYIRPWLTAKRLVSLSAYLEAYITQNRVLCMVDDDDDALIEWVSNRQSIDFKIALLKVPQYSSSEMHGKLMTREDAILYQLFRHYLKSFTGARNEWNKVTGDTVKTAKKQVPGISVISQKWHEILDDEALDFFIMQLWSQSLGVSFYSNPIETSFSSPRLQSSLGSENASEIALRMIEESRWGHARQNNDLIKRQVYDYDVPFIFGAVLRQATSWADLFEVARQMRETREAKAFRQWAAEVDLDLVNFHHYFQEVRGLADELAKGIDAREKNTVRIEFGSRKLLEMPLPFKPNHKGLHLTFLQNLFEWNRSIISLDSDIRRILYPDYTKIELGQKMREWARGCKIQRSENDKKIVLEILPLVSDLDVSFARNMEQTLVKYETHIYSPVYGPVHTGEGNLIVNEQDEEKRE